MKTRNHLRQVTACSFAVAFSLGCAQVASSEVKFAVKRASGTSGTVTLSIHNTTEKPLCLNPASFFPSQFELSVNGNRIQNRSPHVDLAIECLVVAPFAVITKHVDLSSSFSRNELKDGKLCYFYSYGPYPPSKGKKAVVGHICEGKSGDRSTVP